MGLPRVRGRNSRRLRRWHRNVLGDRVARGRQSPDLKNVDALKKGDLKFTLDGVKLKGSWVLKGIGGNDRTWLLIKHRR